jgi:N-acetylglutamate synthase
VRELLLRCELATLRGWSPLAQIEDDGWILSANAGAIGRLNSCAVLSRGNDPLDAKISRAEHFFKLHDLPTAFRMAPGLAPAEVGAALRDCGYQADPDDVLIMSASSAELSKFELGETIGAPSLSVLDKLTEDWLAVFEGEGFAGPDARARALTYERSTGRAFHLAKLNNTPVAAGLSVAFGGVVGVHGMRTAPTHRGRGLAARIIMDIAQHSLDAPLFLHVSRSNRNAVRLYRYLGFEEIGTYAYWKNPSRAKPEHTGTVFG